MLSVQSTALTTVTIPVLVELTNYCDVGSSKHWNIVRQSGHSVGCDQAYAGVYHVVLQSLHLILE